MSGSGGHCPHMRQAIQALPLIPTMHDQGPRTHTAIMDTSPYSNCGPEGRRASTAFAQPKMGTDACSLIPPRSTKGKTYPRRLPDKLQDA